MSRVLIVKQKTQETDLEFQNRLNDTLDKIRADGIKILETDFTQANFYDTSLICAFITYEPSVEEPTPVIIHPLEPVVEPAKQPELDTNTV